jgi:hypothetical protein
MPALTRRRSEKREHYTTWNIYYGDVHVGTIGERAGAPVHVDRWQWRCGFCPGLRPGQDSAGTAATFDEARIGFEAAWHLLLPKVPEGGFDDRKQRLSLYFPDRLNRLIAPSY